jgi:hypothetical protein
MVESHFAFVQALPLGRSKREQELEQARARSHAAKISHRRTRDAEAGQQLVVALTKKHVERSHFLLKQPEGNPVVRKLNATLLYGS